MSIIDKILLGNIVKDFGVYYERSYGLGKYKRSAFLVEKYGRFYFVLKSSAWFLLTGSVIFERIHLEDAKKLQDYIAESETIARNTPPVDYDISQRALRNALIGLVIASVLILLIQVPGFILITIITIIVQANQSYEFNNHPDVGSGTKKLLISFPFITLLMAILKGLWLIYAK